MKLLFCPHCGDVVKLQVNLHRECACGKSYGWYLQDGHRAVVGADTIVLGIDNNELAKVVRRPELRRRAIGPDLPAWVFPDEHPNIGRDK